MVHPDQLPLPPPVVRALLDEQFPQWSHHPLVPVRAGGTVHAVVRIGDGLAARFPLRPDDPAAVRARLGAAADAARRLAARTRVPVPRPVALGWPGPGYPLPWAVQTWLPGRTAVEDDPAASEAFARDLAGFVRGVRTVPTGGAAFRGTGRGGDLRTHDGWVQDRLARSGGLLDVARVGRLWRELRDLPRTAPDTTTHGDLVPGNVLVAGGRLAGVLDLDGTGPADPALDLVGAWHLLDAGPRAVLRTELGCDELEWARGAAWACEQAVGLVEYYAVSHPALSAVGRRTLDRLLADPPV